MLGDNSLENCRGARAVPDTLRVDDGNGPLDAHSQAIRFGPIKHLRHAALNFFQSSLQEFPRRLSARRVTTFRLIRHTEKDVTPDAGDAKSLRYLFDLFRHNS